jgi:hypothetical protein
VRAYLIAFCQLALRFPAEDAGAFGHADQGAFTKTITGKNLKALRHAQGVQEMCMVTLPRIELRLGCDCVMGGCTCGELGRHVGSPPPSAQPRGFSAGVAGSAGFSN